jgi:hypothetical protein
VSAQRVRRRQDEKAACTQFPLRLPSPIDPRRAGLDQLVPQISGLPGFVAGYWVARPANQGLALIMFDSNEAAESFADFLKTAPDARGAMIHRDSIEVAEILAHA